MLPLVKKPFMQVSHEINYLRTATSAHKEMPERPISGDSGADGRQQRPDAPGAS
jgi:hypothetical protein